jgi:hypothetical protein
VRQRFPADDSYPVLVGWLRGLAKQSSLPLPRIKDFLMGLSRNLDPAYKSNFPGNLQSYRKQNVIV